MIDEAIRLRHQRNNRPVRRKFLHICSEEQN